MMYLSKGLVQKGSNEQLLYVRYWYPHPPDLKTAADARNEKALWEYAKDDPKNLKLLHSIAANIANVIEDGYVENRVLINFPGTLGNGLETLRDRHFYEMSTVTELIEKEKDEGRHIFESIIQVILSYAKFGSIKYGDEPVTDERIRTVFGLINDIDAGLMTCSAKERWNVINLIMVRCWDYIRDFCEVCKKRQKEAEAAGGTSSVDDILSEILQSIAGVTMIGIGSSAPIPEASGGSKKSATAAARTQTHARATGYEKGDNFVELFSYAEFDGFDNDDKYRLMDIGARGCNRDGAALRYVAERLAKRPEAVKLLILVSDGQPSDMGYSGTAAEEDLRGIKQEYQRKGIIFVAAAIGNDKPNIERIYGDSFLDITDLKQLPTSLRMMKNMR